MLLLSLATTLTGLTAGAATAAPAVSILSPQAVPTVTSFTPTSGLVGTSVTITGTGFTGVTSVTFNNAPAITFTVNTSSSITATVPVGASTGRVRVINGDGTGRSGTNFTVVQPPTISSFTPASGPVGALVTVNGARLTAATSVRLNGASVAFTQVSGTRVTFTVPVGATSGFISVTTANGTATSANQFTVLPNPPTITSFTPTSGAPGVTSVTITGTNFTGATSVRFATTATSTFTVNSATSITVTVPVGAVSGRIRVVTTSGTALSPTRFTVVAAPTITSIAPTTSAVGGIVTVRGTGFVNVSQVRFNGGNVNAVTYTVNATNRITVTVPVGATIGTIRVTTPSGTGTSTAVLTITASPPTITSLNPTSGNAPQGATPATSVQINGSSFLAGTITNVSFNGVSTTFVRNSNTRITAPVPAGATTGKVSVTTANGTAFSAGNFIVLNTESNPTITAVGPQRECASLPLTVNYTIGDAQTPVNDLTIIASSTSPAIIFTADNVGTGAARNATVEAVDPVAGGTGMLTLTVTDGAGRTASTTFSVTFDPVITADAGPDQNVTANQAVAVSSTVTGTTSTTWTSSGTGSFDNAAATSTNYNPSQADYQAGTVTLTLTASPTGGATCPGASDALVVTFNRPDRTVTGNETISGVYNNVLVIAGAVANNGALDVSGSLVVQSGGSLRSSSCAPVTGVGTFTLEDGATLEICDSQGISTTGMLGQIQVTGARSYGAGANYIYASNAVAQNSGSGLPLDLTGTISVDNGAGGVDLTSNLRLHGVLTLINGDLRVTETASLTIASDAIGTGAVENRAGEVTGTATVQRYISSSLSAAPGYHHLSSPVTAATVGDLATTGFTPVVNNTYNNAGNTNIVQPYPNVFAYDERRAPTSPDFTRGYFSPATLGEVLEPGRGYSVYINGGLTPDFVGTLTNGTINRNGLTRTGNFTGGGQKSGWHITGNPYPSPIDWDLVNVPAGMSNAVFVWRSTGGLNGSYVSYVNGSGTPGTDLIGLGQGIFVRVTSVTPVDFSFTNECRVTNTNVAVFRTAPATRPQLTLSLRGTTAPAAEATEAYVYFQHGATAGYDASFDAARPARNVGVPTLATVVADEELAVNALAPEALAAGTRLPLMVDVPAAGTYELAAKELTNLTGTDVYLLDAVTGTAQPLTADARYRFTTSAAGEQANRFALRFGAGAAANSIAANTLTVSPNPATGRAQVRLTYPATSLTLVDALGRTVRTLALGAGQTDATLDLHNLPAGVYSVRAGASTTRLVVE